MFIINFMTKLIDVEIIYGDVMVYANKNLLFLVMLKGLSIDHLVKLIIGFKSTNKNVEGFLKKLVNQKKNKSQKKFRKRKNLMK